MTSHRLTTVLSAAALALAIAGTAQAQVVNIPLNRISTSLNVFGSGPKAPSMTMHLNGSQLTGYVTPFTISGLPYNASLAWFCLDPVQAIWLQNNQPAWGGNFIQYTSTGEYPTGFDSWSTAATWAAPTWSSGRTGLLENLLAHQLSQANLNLSALQLAVWELMNESDNTFSFSSGRFYVSNMSTGGAAAVTAAEAMLTGLANLPAAPANMGLHFLIDGLYPKYNSAHTQVVEWVRVQDLVGLVPIPEPSQFALAGVAVLGLIAGLKKRRQGRR